MFVFAITTTFTTTANLECEKMFSLRKDKVEGSAICNSYISQRERVHTLISRLAGNQVNRFEVQNVAKEDIWDN